MNPICFYHKADLDGVCSAAIVKHFVPDVELYGIDYGEEFPVCFNDPGLVECANATNKRTVYMVDFSLPVADMEKLTKVSNLVWIDHHKTAIDAAAEMQLNPRGMRSSEYAACELCWAWCAMDAQDKAMPDRGNCPNDIKFFAPPEAVRLLGRYDVWADKNPEWDSKILPFQYGMRAVPSAYRPDSLWWQCQVLGGPAPDGGPVQPMNLDTVLHTGRAILYFQATQNQRACEAGAYEILIRAGRWFDAASGKPTAFDIYAPVGSQRGEQITVRAVACNTTVFNSQFFDGFYDPEKHDVMCAYAQMKNGKWKVSLYTTKDTIDCGVIAKTFGGGGHKKAAGFTCDKLPWEK